MNDLYNGEDTQVAALLHDVIEDTHLTRVDIAKLFTERIGYLVSLVSCPDDLEYDQFITRIIDSKEEAAMRIKLADLYDNTCPSRVVLLAENKRGKQVKYHEAIKRLEEIIYRGAVLSGDIRVPVLEL